jgi:hypothetical protein
MKVLGKSCWNYGTPVATESIVYHVDPGNFWGGMDVLIRVCM